MQLKFKNTSSAIILFIVILLSICIGIGIYTFYYAEGLSYLSNDPKACTNCHIMQAQYDSWTKSSHHKAATCNECHISHNIIFKYIEKASNGWHHSKSFTLQNYPDPIRISKNNLKSLTKNCIECHNDMVSDIIYHGGKQHSITENCTMCHRNVGHKAADF